MAVLHVTNSLVRNGHVSEYFPSKRFSCANKLSSSVASEMQCIQHCLSKETCKILNYKHAADGQTVVGNCEVFHLPAYNQSCSFSNDKSWKAVTFTVSP